MRFNLLGKSALVVSMVCMGSVALLAAPKADQRDAANDGQRAETQVLFNQVQTQAANVENESDQLLALMRDPAITSDLAWEGEAGIFARVRIRVNKLNELVSQLRNEQTEVPPIQRKVIAEIAMPSVELADTTRDAIATLNNNEDRLFCTDLGRLTNDIFQEAKRVNQSVLDFNKYVEVNREARQLKQALGLTRTS